MGMRIDEAEKPDPEPCPEIVGSFNNWFSLRAYDQAIMAAGTGGSMEVFPESPGDGLEIPSRLPGKEYVSMLALIIDIPCGDIRLKAAPSGGKGVSGDFYREGVPRVAPCAGSFRHDFPPFFLTTWMEVALNDATTSCPSTNAKFSRE